MKKLFSVLIASALCCAMLASCGEASADDEIYIPIRTGNTINYDTARAYVGTILEQVTLTGSVTTPYTMDLSFTRISGTIKSIEVRQDYDVHEGDILAVLDDAELEDEIVIQELKLNSARSTYETLQAQRASADDIEFARIDYEIEQLKYDSLIEKREYLTLRAPFDGRITYVYNYRAGSRINQNTPLCTISDSSKVCLTVRDSRGLLSNVSFGTRVDITQGALASTTGRVVDTLTAQASRNDFMGIEWMGENVNVPSEITVYVIQCDEDIEFSELGGIEVTFTTLRRDDAVIVPTEAVFEATDDASKATTHYVNVLMNGIKIETPVTVGLVSGDKTEIINGLDGSETLILR